MTYNQLIQTLYTVHCPVTSEDLCRVTGYKHKFNKYPDTHPTANGDYLVYHLVYGWCIYGYVDIYEWGADDMHLDSRQRGQWFHKVQLWTELNFLEDYNEKLSRSV